MSLRYIKKFPTRFKIFQFSNLDKPKCAFLPELFRKLLQTYIFPWALVAPFCHFFKRERYQEKWPWSIHYHNFTSEMTRCFVHFSLLILWLHSHIIAFWTVAILGKDILLPNVKSSWGLAESFGRKGQSSSINVGYSNLFSNHMRKIDLACFHQLSLSKEI